MTAAASGVGRVDSRADGVDGEVLQICGCRWLQRGRWQRRRWMPTAAGDSGGGDCGGGRQLATAATAMAVRARRRSSWRCRQRGPPDLGVLAVAMRLVAAATAAGNSGGGDCGGRRRLATPTAAMATTLMAAVSDATPVDGAAAVADTALAVTGGCGSDCGVGIDRQWQLVGSGIVGCRWRRRTWRRRRGGCWLRGGGG